MTTALLHRFRQVAVAGFLLAATASSTRAAYTYSLDGGKADAALGEGGSRDILFLNEYAVTPGNNVIGSVSFTVGCPGAVSQSLLGSSVRTLIYSDPNGDGDPSGAMLLEIGTGTITSVDQNVFQTFSFATPVTLSGTSFFVGFELNAKDSTLPGPLDGGSQDGYIPAQNRSFFASDTVGNINLYDLTANDHPITSLNDIAINANFLIRANTTVPEPSTCILLGAGLAAGGLMLRSRRQATA